MATKKSTSKAIKTTEEKKVPAVAKTAALAEPEKKKLPAATKSKVKTVTKAVKKVAAKAVDKHVEAENFFEFDGMQIRELDIRSRIEEAYKDTGHRISSIKTLQVYYNFAERRAYYVINGKPEGLFIEF